MRKMGFSSLLIVLGIAALLIAFLLGNTWSNVCTADVKQCPDGSYVGRNPYNNCQFKPCPTPTTTTTVQQGSSVEILSVEIVPKNPKVGNTYQYNVTFRNSGDRTIYYIRGCGSSLRIDILENEESTASIQSTGRVEKIMQPLCLCEVMLTPFEPGEVAQAIAPTCADGYIFNITEKGSIVANLTIWWGTKQTDFDKSISFIHTITVG